MSEILQGWHWPIFEKTICGTMTDRERLGLPEHYVEDRFADAMDAAINGLRCVDANTLVQICEDGNTALIDRLAAGNLLALAGDPRIHTHDPAMITIPSDSPMIGLDESSVDAVLDEFSGLGLDRKWLLKECPRHRVVLTRYRIGKYPVTNQEYRDFLRDSRYPELPSSWAFGRYPHEHSNHPVYSVSAVAADAYARWLASATGRPFRLPTEAEWEYAAAGSDGLAFPWGDHFDADRANTAESGLFMTSPVGVFVSGNSPFGAADMAGNVEEYVVDTYAAYPGGQFIVDHLSESQHAYRIARGGSFARFRDLARTRRRHGCNPKSATYAMGFRLAESA